jgi:hypothetical protein
MSEWDKDLNAFWMGGNGCEYIAWKGSHQVFVYPTWEHPAPPSEVIQHTKRIETLADFNEALDLGRHIKAEYVLTDQEREDFKNNNTERKVLIDQFKAKEKEYKDYAIREVRKRDKRIRIYERVIGGILAGMLIYFMFS